MSRIEHRLHAAISWIFASSWLRGRRGYVTYGLLGFVALFAVLTFFAQFYDPTRQLYKRAKAPSEYTYEKIHPRFLRTDPADLISIETPLEAHRLRRKLIRALWGQSEQPFDLMPTKIESNVGLEGFEDTENLAQVDRLRMKIVDGYTAVAYSLKPKNANGKLVLYQHGYAGTFQLFAHHIKHLIAEGYAVIALNFYDYGENRPGEAYFERYGWHYLRPNYNLFIMPDALRVHLNPAIISINYGREILGYEDISMMGFSAGGWVTTVVAAVDPRLRRSYSIAGTYPLYLRTGEKQDQTIPQYFPALIGTANYLEMYILAALGEQPSNPTTLFEEPSPQAPKRHHMQMYNVYDRCCFFNRKAELFVDVVKDKVVSTKGGAFDIFLDDTHADHKISDHLMAAILEDLERTPERSLALE